MTKENAFQILQDSFSSLHRSGILELAITVQQDTVILGAGSPLDSLAFVTFITDLEDRISNEVGKEFYLVLAEIHEFNGENQCLTAGKLADYIVCSAEK